jgi:hypothetical protein
MIWRDVTVLPPIKKYISPDNMNKYSESKSPRTIETIAGLHQYYRDCLSQPVDFPDIGQCPP